MRGLSLYLAVSEPRISSRTVQDVIMPRRSSQAAKRSRGNKEDVYCDRRRRQTSRAWLSSTRQNQIHWERTLFVRSRFLYRPLRRPLFKRDYVETVTRLDEAGRQRNPRELAACGLILRSVTRRSIKRRGTAPSTPAPRRMSVPE